MITIKTNIRTVVVNTLAEMVGVSLGEKEKIIKVTGKIGEAFTK